MESMKLQVLIFYGLVLILAHLSFLEGQADIVFPDKTKPPPPPHPTRFQRPRPTWPTTTVRTMTPTSTAWAPPPPSTPIPPPPMAFPSTSKQTTKCDRLCVVLDLCPAMYKLLDHPTRQNLRLLKESSCGFTSIGDPLVWCDEFVCDPVKKRGSGVLQPALRGPIPLTLRPENSYFSDRNSNSNSNGNENVNTWTMTPFVSTRSAFPGPVPVPFAAPGPSPAPTPTPRIFENSSGKDVQNIFGSTTASGAMNLAFATVSQQKSSFKFPNDGHVRVPPSISTSASTPLNSGSDSLNSADCGIAFPSRISGGSNAGKGEFPWIVAISVHSKNGPQVICGGALISSTWVLTAAHCLADSAHNLRNVSHVRLGAHNISNLLEEGAEIVGVRRIVVHSEFRERPLVKNDIALLQLDRSLVPSNVIGPICLPMDAGLSDSLYAPGSSATIAGWGSDGTKLSYSILQKVDVPIVDGETCRRDFYRVRVRVVPSIQICAGEPQKDSCKGDSGGPLMRDVNGRTTLIGIISFGTSQCDGRLPGVYTKITSYSQWIGENVRKYSKLTPVS